MSGFLQTENLDQLPDDDLPTKLLNVSSQAHGTWDETNNCPWGLDLLQTTRHLFIRKSRNRIMTTHIFPNQFDILNSSNTRLFTAIETTPSKVRARKPQRSFKFSVRNSEGNEIFLICGIPVTSFRVFYGGEEWGGTSRHFEQDNVRVFPIEFMDEHEPPKSHEVVQIREKDWSTNVGICGCNYKLPREKMWIHTQDIDGDVCLPDGVSKIGRIGWYWSSKDGIECEQKHLGTVTGVRFPLRIDSRIKTLLLGSLFMLDRRLYQDAPTNTNDDKEM